MRITDRTLSCVDDRSNDKSALVRFLQFLIKMDPGAIELSERMYHLLSPLPEYHYILHIEQPGDAAQYPHIAEFVCRNGRINNPKIRIEIPLDNTLKASAEIIAQYASRANVRIQGLDYTMCDDYIKTFENLKKTFNDSDNIEFSPCNHFNCATALAAEWLISGAGTRVATAFAGYGGFAPTEEVIMILREYGLRDKSKTYAFFPEMARLFQKITKKNVSLNKPVIGSRIFHVESGVHVDGILKQPKCYEPFPPEVVGQRRKFVLGKHSGTASVHAKLSEFDITCEQERIPFILDQIKKRAVEKSGEVSDQEFLKLINEQLPQESIARKHEQ